MSFTSIVMGLLPLCLGINLIQCESTTIGNIHKVGQHVEIRAFVKVPFYFIKTSTATYGSGSIIDKAFILRVNIADFDQNGNIHAGSYVIIKGEKKYDHASNVYLQVQNNDDITLVNELDTTPEVLRKGVLTPKKAAENEIKSTEDNKRIKSV